MVEPLPQSSSNGESSEVTNNISTEACTERAASETTAQTRIEPEVIDCRNTEEETKTTETDWKVEHTRKCEVFIEWCRSNGVKWPKVEYPSYFEGGLVGVKAIEPIEHREAFMSIPYKMLMTVDAAQKHPVIGKIIEENPQLFSEDEKGDWEQLTLSLYLIFEYQKGEDSFWKPYIDLMPDVTFFCHYPEEDIIATQDFQLIQYANDYKQELF